jgi:hypothetical protein
MLACGTRNVDSVCSLTVGRPKKPRVPQPDVTAVRVASLAETDRALASGTTKFFTDPHYNGFPAILVNLPGVTVRELEPLIMEAWRCQAAKDLTP